MFLISLARFNAVDDLLRTEGFVGIELENMMIASSRFERLEAPLSLGPLGEAVFSD